MLDARRVYNERSEVQEVPPKSPEGGAIIYRERLAYGRQS